MRNTLVALAIAGVLAVLPVHAEMLSKQALPEKVSAQLMQRHPNAIDISAELKTHFKQDLYEITFKENDAEHTELYRTDGHFFTNAEKMASVGEMATTVGENLTAEFGQYFIDQSYLVVNPNGAGEEYDLVVNAGGTIWHVTIDRNGGIARKEKQ
ncbi:MAG: hypothetical protein CTY29_07550 [Methylobacter sp.]|nr:MAG: hypothetical protein CTY29_07550 [Methylobacter sp.]PPD17488.1 MAG: hypothetical protein CTY24_14785 [Methylobacter sp.]PPD36512.1 MAG: hypothetical protein CTY18_03820 [Methylomonas sp.]